MKKTLCFYFQVHQPFRLRQYRFFDIGENHQYFDDFENKKIMRKVAERCYLPMNQLLLDLIHEYGKRFKIAFSITGQVIEQMELYAPEVLASFKQLANTGCVEFLAETYAHSLAFLKNDAEFENQIKRHSQLIEKHFGQKPTTFRLTELIYSDDIGAQIAKMGFKTMITEGAKHVMGWKSPNYVYTNAINPRLKVLLRNSRLSDDISFRFSEKSWGEWPVTSDKFAAWLNAIQPKEEIVNVFMDYETFGEHQRRETGIFEFLRFLPHQIFSSTNFEFLTPDEAAKKHQPIAAIHTPFAISWADEERDLSAWVGNDLQNDAFNSLYELADQMQTITDPALISDWIHLQASDHFYYMCTKWFSDGSVHKYFNPYNSPYEAYINYMNVLSDFKIRVNNHATGSVKTKTTPTAKKAASAKKETVKKEPAKKSATTKETSKKVDNDKKKTTKKPAVKKESISK